jgi:hypothetical protein
MGLRFRSFNTSKASVGRIVELWARIDLAQESSGRKWLAVYSVLWDSDYSAARASAPHYFTPNFFNIYAAREDE